MASSGAKVSPSHSATCTNIPEIVLKPNLSCINAASHNSVDLSFSPISKCRDSLYLSEVFPLLPAFFEGRYRKGRLAFGATSNRSARCSHHWTTETYLKMGKRKSEFNIHFCKPALSPDSSFSRTRVNNAIVYSANISLAFLFHDQPEHDLYLTYYSLCFTESISYWKQSLSFLAEALFGGSSLSCDAPGMEKSTICFTGEFSGANKHSYRV